MANVMEKLTWNLIFWSKYFVLIENWKHIFALLPSSKNMSQEGWVFNINLLVMENLNSSRKSHVKVIAFYCPISVLTLLFFINCYCLSYGNATCSDREI